MGNIARTIRRAGPLRFTADWSCSTVYQRVPSKEETQKSQTSIKKIAERVYLVKYNSVAHEMLVHLCEDRGDYKEMTFRENDDGPMYWCEGCGFVLDDGTAMAIRLYEAPIS
jgi:hypothetical protein